MTTRAERERDYIGERHHDCDCTRPHDTDNILGHTVTCCACGLPMRRNTYAVHLADGWSHRYLAECHVAHQILTQPEGDTP